MVSTDVMIRTQLDIVNDIDSQFAVLDVNEDAVLSAEEFKAALPVSMDETKKTDLFNAVDMDNDGQITPADIAAYRAEQLPLEPMRQALAKVAAIIMLVDIAKHVDSDFDNIDADGSSEISQDEWRNYVTELLGVQSINEDGLANDFMIADTDGSGALSRAELQEHFMAMLRSLGVPVDKSDALFDAVPSNVLTPSADPFSLAAFS